VVAVDISAGTGASNSVIVVGDKKTGEKVAEFASPYLKPHELAKLAVAIGKWFKGQNGRNALINLGSQWTRP